MYQQIYYGNNARSIENLPNPLQIHQQFPHPNHHPHPHPHQQLGSFQYFSLNNPPPPPQIHQHQQHQNHQYQYPQTSSPRMGRSRKSSRLTSSTSLLSNDSNNSIKNEIIDNTIDQITASRTILIKNLSQEVTFNELLNQINHGPIEKIGLKKEINNSNENCFISFVNSKISSSFYSKYNNNNNNDNNENNENNVNDELKKLREVLKSKNLQISMSEYNEPKINNHNNNLSPFDNIKLKVLNYILEFQATRCLKLNFKIKNILPDDISTDDRLNQIQQFIVNQCEKFGDIEDFQIKLDKEEEELKEEEKEIESSKEEQNEVEEKDTKHEKEDQNLSEEAEEEKEIKYINGEVIVHFTSIESAITGYENYSRRIYHDLKKLTNNKESIRKRSSTSKDINDINSKFNITFTAISFNKDRCDQTIVHENSTNSNISKFSANSNDLINNNEVDEYEFESENSTISDEGYSMLSSSSRFSQVQPVQLIPYINYNNIEPSNNNRSLYLGNLHPSTTIEEIANNVRAGGLVESINYFPEKKMCFITFIDAAIAYKFYKTHQQLHQLVIHGCDITVGWAKQHSGPLSRDIALAVTAGASRNVYIGIKNNKDSESPKPLIPTEEELRKDFSNLGSLEQINFFHNNDCAFLNFINIKSAIALINIFNLEEKDSIFKLNKFFNNPTKAEEFYGKYKKFKISFAKDRCASVAKYSFLKSSGNAGSTYKLYKDQLHASVKKNGKYHKNKHPQQQDMKPDDAMINDEAAMVFGIIKDLENNKIQAEEANGKHETENGELKNSTEGTEPAKNGEIHKEDQIEEEDEGESDDDDDDDDVSIIIGSVETTSTNNTTTTGKQNGHTNNNHSNNKTKSNKPPFRYQKVYHNQDNSFSQRKFSRNSSNISINSSIRYNNNDSFGHQQQHSIPQSPYMQPQPVYFLPPLSRTSSASSFRSSQKYQPSPNPNIHAQPVFVQQPPMVIPSQPQSQPFYSPNPNMHQFQPPPTAQFTNGNQQIRYVSVVQSPQIMQLPLPSPQFVGHKTPFTTSGSQVMAQYLANAQQQEAIYEHENINNNNGNGNGGYFYGNHNGNGSSNNHHEFGNRRGGNRNRKSS
ncbi:hypothetical protein KGF54_003069 [Candida jiufengensis]|uniref:uncharacterized protein n=1 Tax=Candida jiufengensis TaxID=497108 RepID=UPI00222413BD|nr:uncharacterized protein KGF54_003069 [Candida jiufengensis]KAI5953697.1 hypothetical protein KGF54_003069 [Candida jiufengensis]